MSTTATTHQSDKRRLFITAGADHYQLFSFHQNRSDGSIYVSSPAFDSVKWLIMGSLDASGQPSLQVSDMPGAGKLSLHGSGVTHVRSSGDPASPQVRVRGNFLGYGDAQMLGVRHLFTVLLSEPFYLPASPAFNRISDYSFQVDRLIPYVIVFWAVPGTKRLTVQMNVSFEALDLETIPPPSGWGVFGLALHSVVWFGYRTKHMERWPKHTHISFHDGYFVPILIGTGEGSCRAEFRPPHYSLSDTTLTITL